MMSIIFIVFLIAILLAWKGMRTAAIAVFGLSLILGIIVFIHHLSTHIDLAL